MRLASLYIDIILYACFNLVQYHDQYENHYFAATSQDVLPIVLPVCLTIALAALVAVVITVIIRRCQRAKKSNSE